MNKCSHCGRYVGIPDGATHRDYKGVYWQFVNVIKGMGDACRKFETPVTGGNVSFYNQSIVGDKAIPVSKNSIFPNSTFSLVIGLFGSLGIFEKSSLSGKVKNSFPWLLEAIFNTSSSSASNATLLELLSFLQPTSNKNAASTSIQLLDLNFMRLNF